MLLKQLFIMHNIIVFGFTVRSLLKWKCCPHSDEDCEVYMGWYIHRPWCIKNLFEKILCLLTGPLKKYVHPKFSIFDPPPPPIPPPPSPRCSLLFVCHVPLNRHSVKWVTPLPFSKKLMWRFYHECSNEKSGSEKREKK